ncbi:pyruvate flavodoxin oxidoreductase subunit gamma [Caminibacter mediatlanticus TB-2]|uniref:Pyruvate flavodoxin oxidoreductase subunit gamma n=1 Tax=Caminibacter mediatlanticus TB-2 TaxID=391592 RepID=A0ABX5V7F0_9BACT|nr:pyruvate flavodoxin oxidoreductase subunit gamma [Caminibacter mediatlanticus]QCT94202.1 pyruvate flavodoxin oxidoreductase subunit gamma [Caminibacter mediatlanticus TB-2]
MLQIRWHSRAGQGAVTGAKALADVMARTGKYVQAYSVYGAEKRGAPMTAYDKIDDKPILDHSKWMAPDYVLVIDPSLVFSEEIVDNTHDDTIFIVTTHLDKDDLLAVAKHLQGKKVYIIDAIKISQEEIGRAIPNTPMLGAFIKVSGIIPFEDFLVSIEDILSKFPQKIIEGNLRAIKRAYEEVK